MERTLNGVMRLSTVALLAVSMAGCAARVPAPAPPSIGRVEVAHRPAGAAVLVDADIRWARYRYANQAALVEALATAKHTSAIPVTATPAAAPTDRLEVIPIWEPRENHFVIRYRLEQTSSATWQEGGGACGKYDHLQPQAPSPAPCAPPIVHPVTRVWGASLALTLVYGADGNWVSEQPSPPAPMPADEAARAAPFTN